MSGATGYQGFRSWSAMPCAGLKPGETLNNRATKFQGVGFGVVYKNGAPTHDTQYKSVGQETSVAHGDYRVPNRLGVMAHRVEKYKPRPAKFLGTSTSASTHVDFNADDRALANATDDDFREAFNKVDEDSTGFVQLCEMRKLLRFALAADPSERVVAKFVKVFEANQDAQATAEEIVAALPAIRNLVRADLFPPQAADPLGAAKSAQASVLNARPMASSHQLDVGTPGSVPQDRGYRYKSGMASTTLDLNLGTTKDSYHIPGYGGFLAQSKNSEEAATSSNGAYTRGKSEDLRLYYSHDLPGYTGHKPSDVKNDYGMRKGGCDPRTTSGAAAIGL